MDGVDRDGGQDPRIPTPEGQQDSAAVTARPLYFCTGAAAGATGATTTVLALAPPFQ